MLAGFLLGAPTAVNAQAAARAGEQIYKEVCSVCHATGVANAPTFGDKAKWASRIKEGQTHVTADGWIGERGMPAKGGRDDLSLEEFAKAVAFMARAAGASWKDPDAKMLQRIRSEESKRRQAMKATKK